MRARERKTGLPVRWEVPRTSASSIFVDERTAVLPRVAVSMAVGEVTSIDFARSVTRSESSQRSGSGAQDPSPNTGVRLLPNVAERGRTELGYATVPEPSFFVCPTTHVGGCREWA